MRAVGAALTQWEALESEFALLFSLVVGGGEAAERAYGTIQGTKGRRDALEAAAAVYFYWTGRDTEVSAQFALLMNHYTSASGRRNDIAHAVVQRVSVGSADHGHFLMPPRYATKRHKKLQFETLVSDAKGLEALTHEYRFTSADVYHFARRFAAMAGWTTELREKARKLPFQSPLRARGQESPRR